MEETYFSEEPILILVGFGILIIVGVIKYFIERVKKMNRRFIDRENWPKCPNCSDKCMHLEKGNHIYVKKPNCCKCNDILDNPYSSCTLH